MSFLFPNPEDPPPLCSMSSHSLPRHTTYFQHNNTSISERPLSRRKKDYVNEMITSEENLYLERKYFHIQKSCSSFLRFPHIKPQRVRPESVSIKPYHTGLVVVVWVCVEFDTKDYMY